MSFVRIEHLARKIAGKYIWEKSAAPPREKFRPLIDVTSEVLVLKPQVEQGA